MFKRILLTVSLVIVMIVVAACGGNGDNGDNGESGSVPEAAEDRRPIEMTVSGAVNDSFGSGGMSLCLTEDASGDTPEFVILSTGGIAYLFYMLVPSEIIAQGPGTYPLVTDGTSTDSAILSFEIQERSWSNGVGEVTIDNIPSVPGEQFQASVNIELTNFEGETLTLNGSTHMTISSEDSVSNCFGA